MFHIFSALAEFERDIIRERTQAGLTAARARGRKGGRPRLLDEKGLMKVIALHENKALSIQEICKMLQMTKPTFYRYLKQAKMHVQSTKFINAQPPSDDN